MPFLEREDGARIYYELHGSGPPVVFLNGIMMSTLSWAHLVPEVARRYQVVLMDFRDQGRSSRMDREYGLDLHVEDLRALLDHLGFERIHLLGLSYGGQVALKFALAHQERLYTLLLPNTNHYITTHLREIGDAWEIAASLYDGEKFFKLAIPFIYSRHFYERALDALRKRQEMFKEMLTQEWFEALIRLIHSTADFRVSPGELEGIKVPTLLIGAEDDIITPLAIMEEMRARIEKAELVVIPKAGHGAFIERPREFLSAVLGFLAKYPRGEGR